jgi:hypothetical protein
VAADSRRGERVAELAVAGQELAQDLDGADQARVLFEAPGGGRHGPAGAPGAAVLGGLAVA